MKCSFPLSPPSSSSTSASSSSPSQWASLPCMCALAPGTFRRRTPIRRLKQFVNCLFAEHTGVSSGMCVRARDSFALIHNIIFVFVRSAYLNISMLTRMKTATQWQGMLAKYYFCFFFLYSIRLCLHWHDSATAHSMLPFNGFTMCGAMDRAPPWVRPQNSKSATQWKYGAHSVNRLYGNRDIIFTAQKRKKWKTKRNDDDDGDGSNWFGVCALHISHSLIHCVCVYPRMPDSIFSYILVLAARQRENAGKIV